MASSGLQLLGFVLGLFGFLATVVAAWMAEWKWKQGIKEDVYEGLWEECAIDRDGKKRCDPHESILDITNDLQAVRAVMLASIFLSGMALLVSVFGMKCTRLLDRDQPKGTVALVGGVLLLIAGLSTLIITSWFVQMIVQSYHNQRHSTEFGSAIFVSWGGSILTLAGGVLLCCRKCSGSPSSSSSSSSVTPPKLLSLRAEPRSEHV